MFGVIYFTCFLSIHKVISLFKNVMKNYFHPHYISVLCIRITSGIWKVINIISAKCWSVKLGSDCSFKGKCIWRKLPETNIIIGNNCSFNSNHRSNLIGIYTPCMFSTLKKNASIQIGNHCGFSGTVIGAAKLIIIGNNVRCGANTMITDSDWHTEDYRTSKDRAVIIDNNVWLGYGVKVLKGVHIGENSLIGAGSIVTKDIPANVIAAGNPCKVIRHL